MENIIYYLLVIIGTALACVVGLYFLKLPFFRLATSAVRQMDIIMDSAIDDDEKDKIIIKNLSSLLGSLFKVLFLLIVAIVIGIIPAYLLVRLSEMEAVDLSSWYFYLSMLLGSLVLFLFNKKDSDYSYWSKLIHAMVLDNYSVEKFLLKKELKKLPEAGEGTERPFVIVSGLARSGTTALTNLLYDPKDFHSISYANMPFLMAPRFWKRFYNPTQGKMKERAHGDRVLFSEKSIEALEEHFFKAHLNDSYIHDSSLDVHEVEEELAQKYRKYQQLFKEDAEDTVYLAKNNNFILRYESMKKHCDSMSLIMIFRDPVDHAFSLNKQHVNFVQQQTEDPFVLDYMNWLGHYEFGLNHKVFDLGTQNSAQNHSPDSLNYWLAIWVNYHNYLLQYLDDKNLHLVHYDDFLHKPDALKTQLSERIGVAMTVETQDKFNKSPSPKDLSSVEPALLNEAKKLYEELISKKMSLL